MNIRQEQPADYDEIYKLVQTAFETAKVKDGNEQDFVLRLRGSVGRYIPQLALVAVENNALVGHVMFTKLQICAGDKVYEELMLAPLCTALAYRGKGVGGELIREGFRLAKEMGYSAVFLCGDPAYYSRFGFKVTTEFGIENLSDIPPQYVMGCELYEHALAHKSGTIRVE